MNDTGRPCPTAAGAVFWITGLPRSGKTTLARALAGAIRSRGLAAIELDGDLVRAAFGGDLGYSYEDRLVNARRLSQLCKLISDQGLIVICSTVSLFTEIHELNRSTLSKYVEVVLDCPSHLLRRRDPALYEAADRGEALLPGVNQDFELPQNPDIMLSSAGCSPEEAVKRLLAWLN